MTDPQDMISRKAVLEAINPLLTALLDMTVTKSDVSIIAASIRALPSVGVTVKPLEWVETKVLRKHLVEGETVIEFTTKGQTTYTLTKNYQIGLSWSAYRGRNTPVAGGTCVSLESAKAAAQADYAARILAALDVQPAPDAAMVRAEALEDAAKACDRIAGNTADFPRDHRRAAGQCAAMIRALITTPAPSLGNFALSETLQGVVENLQKAPRWDTATDRPAPSPDVQELIEAAQWARNRLELIADESWHGDGRDLKRSIVGVFADFDAALAKCGSYMPDEIRSTTKPAPSPDVAALIEKVIRAEDMALAFSDIATTETLSGRTEVMAFCQKLDRFLFPAIRAALARKGGEA